MISFWTFSPTIRDNDDIRRLAGSIYDTLKVDERAKAGLSEGLAREMKFASSFGHGRLLADRLVEVNLLTDTSRADLESAFEVNAQTEDARLNDDLQALLLT